MLYHIKLSTGEDIFAYIDSPNHELLKLRKPLILTASEDEYGEMSLYFMNYIPYTDEDTCIISASNVIMMAPVNDTAKQFYEMSSYFVAETDNLRQQSIERSISSMSTTIYEDEYGMDDDIIGATFH